MLAEKLLGCAVLLLLSTMAQSCGTKCYPPLGVSGEARSASAENVTILFARCHTACVDKFYALMMMECRRGCVEGGRMSGGCKTACNASCRKECGSNSTCNYEDTTCQVDCKDKFCKKGCNTYTAIFESHNQDSLRPQAPLSPPIFVRNESPTWRYHAGMFNINATAPVRARESSSNATAFIFKIETNQTSYFLFKESLDPNQIFNLSRFACTVVNISFAAVNCNGMSAYSPPTEVCIHGETRFPSQPRDVSYAWVWDSRPGFHMHAVINITWQRPQGYEYVTHYLLTLFSPPNLGCGDFELYRYSIHRSATSFVLKSEHPSQPPIVNHNCRAKYQVEVKSQPSRADARGSHLHLFLDPENVPPPSMNLSCHRVVNETTGKIAVYFFWEVGNNPRVLSAIDHYSVLVVIVEADQSDIPDIKDVLWSNSSLQARNGSGSYVVYDILPRTQPNYRIRVQVTPAPEQGMDSSIIPDRKECIMIAAPERPSPINNATITIHNFEIDRRGWIFLNLSWEKPKFAYGDITMYRVRIVREPVYSGEPPNSAIAAWEEMPMSTSGSFGLINGSQSYVNAETLCLYAQVQLKNRFLWSEWSGPVTLERYPSLYLNCTKSTRGTEEPTPTVAVPLHVYIVAGAGGCTLIALLMLIFIVVKLCKKYRMKKELQRVFNERGGYQNPMFKADRSGSRRISRPSISGPRTDKWEIPAGHVIVEEWLGEGCFGEVRKGVVKGPIPNSQYMKTSICVTVAIKLLKSSATGSERTDFLHEIDTMKKIAKGNNPHVVGLVGCVTIQEPLCLITEFVKHGDLLSFLQNIRKLVTQRNRAKRHAKTAQVKEPEPYLVPRPQNPEAQADDSEAQTEAVVPPPDSPYADLGEVEPVNLISFAYQIAHGMEYLASLDIVHRDLACRNILVGENKSLKISDFGMSREVVGDDIYVKTSKGRLPWKWMAIESIVNREFTSASDVWAYGVVLWEIGTLGGFPYPMIPNGELLEHLKRGHRLEPPQNCSREIYNIMQECWNDDPADRPTFTQLKAKFDMMLAEDNPYIQFDNINTHKPYYNSLSSSSDEKMSGNEFSQASGSSPSSSATLQDSGICTNAYDYLKPRVPEVHLEDSLLHPIVNPYVDTPTKLPYDSAFDLDIVGTQQTIHEDPETSDSAITDL